MHRTTIAILLLSFGILDFFGSGRLAAGERILSPELVRARWGDSLDRVIERARSALEAEAGARESVDSGGGDAHGGGASVADLITIQISYEDEDEVNSFLWVWRVPAPNPAGITLYANGEPVLDSVSGEPLVLDGYETTTVTEGIAAGGGGLGLVTRMVQGSNNSRASDDLVGLRAQPFDDPVVTCEGGAMDPGTKLCSLLVKIKNSRVPSFYALLEADEPDEDENPLDQDIPGAAKEHSLAGYSSGNYCVTLTGWLHQGESDYLGDPVESCTRIDCQDLACDPISAIEYCQSGFGPGETDNTVSFEWRNGEADYTEIRVIFDEETKDPLSGTLLALTMEGLAPGAHTLSLEGDCGGARGTSPPTVLEFTLVTTPPATAQPENLSCRFTSPDYGRATLTWKNVGTAEFIEVFAIDTEGAARLLLTVAGQATGANVEGTLRGDRLGLRAHFDQAGACFGAELVLCTPDLPPGYEYQTGDCDADGNYALTDAIFSLNYLFRGGAAPLCEAACNTNRDGIFNLTDAVYTLNHLFLGGAQPPGKYPKCEEGYPEDVPGCSVDICKV